MRYLFLTALLCSFLGAAPYERNREAFSPYRTVKLDSAGIVCTFAPDQLGRLASVKLKKNGAELTGEFKLSRYTETPLFYLDSGNFQGIRELLWRRNLSGIAPMTVKERSDTHLLFETANYGGSSLGLSRKVSVRKESFIIDFESTFTNNGKKDEKIAVWLNLQGAPPAKPVIPVEGTGTVPMRGKIELYFRPFIFTGAGGNSNLPPAADWGGFKLPGRGTVWVLQAPAVTQGGFFYSWGNQDHRAPIRTVEPVFPEVTLKPGAKSPVFRYRVLVFPGVEGINGVLGETAVEVRPRGKGTEILFCSALPAARKEEITLTLLDTQSKTIFRKKYTLPPGKAGVVTAFQEKFSGTPASGTLEKGKAKAKLFFEKEK